MTASAVRKTILLWRQHPTRFGHGPPNRERSVRFRFTSMRERAFPFNSSCSRRTTTGYHGHTTISRLAHAHVQIRAHLLHDEQPSPAGTVPMRHGHGPDLPGPPATFAVLPNTHTHPLLPTPQRWCDEARELSCTSTSPSVVQRASSKEQNHLRRPRLAAQGPDDDIAVSASACCFVARTLATMAMGETQAHVISCHRRSPRQSRHFYLARQHDRLYR